MGLLNNNNYFRNLLGQPINPQSFSTPNFFVNLPFSNFPTPSDPIVRHHYNSLDTGNFMDNDGKISTVYTMQVNDPRVNSGLPTLIPSLLDGQMVDQQQAINRAVGSGINYPFRNTHQELREYDELLHNMFIK